MAGDRGCGQASILMLLSSRVFHAPFSTCTQFHVCGPNLVRLWMQGLADEEVDIEDDEDLEDDDLGDESPILSKPSLFSPQVSRGRMRLFLPALCALARQAQGVMRTCGTCSSRHHNCAHLCKRRRTMHRAPAMAWGWRRMRTQCWSSMRRTSGICRWGTCTQRQG